MTRKNPFIKRLELEFLRFLKAIKNNPWASNIEDIYFIYRPFLVLYRFFHFIFLDFIQKKTLMLASALSYATMLGIIPVMLVIVSLSKGFLAENLPKYAPSIVDYLVYKVAPVFKNFNADSGVDLHNTIQGYINNHLIPMITNLNFSKIGIFGAIVLIVISFSLFRTIEKALNDIWGITVRRAMWKVVLNYWLVMALFPVIMLVILWLTGFNIFKDILNVKHSYWFAKLLSEQTGTFIAMWVLCSIMYSMIPNTRVRFIPAIIGGIVGGTLWQLNNMLSFMFVSNAIRTHYIYGSIGLIPILLIALFAGWLIILFGAHVSFAIQNLELFRVQILARHVQPYDQQEMSVMCISIVALHFVNRKMPPTLAEISLRSGLPEKYLSTVLGNLREAGYLDETSDFPSRYVLTVPPESISLKNIMDNAIGAYKSEKGMPLVSNKKLWKDVVTVCSKYRCSYENEANPFLTDIIKKLNLDFEQSEN